MATRNGGKFIKEQLDSILHQLQPCDELVITDDASTDNTCSILSQYQAVHQQIKLSRHPTPQGVTRTFEHSLKSSRGEHIFLADQDDIWLAQKVRVMRPFLDHYDLVISDCLLMEHNTAPSESSFFQRNGSGKGLLKNIFRNSYMGCCMAFNRKLLNRALPFPKNIPIHDHWLGLIGERYYNVHFISEILVYHRRHTANASSSGGRSPLPLTKKIASRYQIIKNLLLH
jgi:glycosyltransferase involved in cell wall biosynthesis